MLDQHCSVYPVDDARCHVPAVVDVVLVGDGDHLTLVSHEPYRPPDLRGDGALEASLPQEAVNGLGLVPALREWHFRQKGGSLPVPALAEPLYPDAVTAELPVGPVRPVLEVAEDGHRHVQVGQLVSCNGTEPKQKVYKIRVIRSNKRSFNFLPGVLHGTSYSVFPETILELHLIEGTNTT